jgi:hypothetical protein
MHSSLETNDATVNANSLASFRNGEARPTCIVCRAEILDNQWFCRLSQNGNGNGNGNGSGDAHGESPAILLCSPRCALRHFGASRPPDNGFDSDFEPYERTFSFFMDGEASA